MPDVHPAITAGEIDRITAERDDARDCCDRLTGKLAAAEAGPEGAGVYTGERSEGTDKLPTNSGDAQAAALEAGHAGDAEALALAALEEETTHA